MIFLFRFRKIHEKYTAYQDSDSDTVQDVSSVNKFRRINSPTRFDAQDY